MHLDSSTHDPAQKDEKEVDFFADCHNTDNNSFSNNITNNNYELSTMVIPDEDVSTQNDNLFLFSINNLTNRFILE